MDFIDEVFDWVSYCDNDLKSFIRGALAFLGFVFLVVIITAIIMFLVWLCMLNIIGLVVVVTLTVLLLGTAIWWAVLPDPD